MPMISERLVALTFVWATLCSAIVSVAPAHAQSFSGPEQYSTNTGGGGGSSSGAPLFRIPNFIGDRRVDDLYGYMHPVEHESWDTYRKRLEEAARRIANQQPTQLSPTPDNANGSPGSVMSGYGNAAGAFASTMSSGMQGTSGGAYSGYSTGAGAQGVSTSVSGQVLGPGQVPGLVE